MMDDVRTTARSPLVGRTSELAQLERWLAVGSERPTSAAVLLGGDAGVGKTRLLAELRAHAVAAGWRVLAGHCVDLGDGGLPYLPFGEALGQLRTEAPALAAAVLEEHPRLAALQLGTTAAAGAGPRTPVDERSGAVDRAGLFEAVHAGLSRAAAAGPLLLLVEDVHWADSSSRDLLSYLFGRGFDAPVSVLASYRTDDLHRRHPLRPTLAEWARIPGLERTVLDGLPAAEVRALVGALDDRPLTERELARIVDRADGNAFYVEELVAAAQVDDCELPDDLADLLLVRLERLDPTAREIVRAAAVAGRRVPHSLLAEVLTLDPAELDAGLRQAVDQNVLVPTDLGYAFRHALLAEAVYDDLLPGERVRLHAAYASALGTGSAPGSAAELARHARAAQDPETALSAGIQAGVDAMERGGPEEAARHFEVALELAASGAGASVDHVELTVSACQALSAAGHPLRALELAEQTLDRLPADAPTADRARLVLEVASGRLETDPGADPLLATTDAIHLIPAEPAGVLRARAMILHARANDDRNRLDEAGRWARSALEMAEQLGRPDLTAEATTTLARLERRAGDPESARVGLEASVAQARAAGQVTAELRGLMGLGGLLFELGRLDEAAKVYLEATDRAAATGRTWAPYGLDSRVIAAVVAYVAGDWEAVEDITDLTGTSPPPLAEAGLRAARLTVSAGRGDGTALEVVAALRPTWALEGMVALTSGAAAIDLHGDRGDLAAAEAVHDDLVRSVAGMWQTTSFGARIRLSGLLLGVQASAAAETPAVDRPALVARGVALLEAALAAAGTPEERTLTRQLGVEGRAWLLRCRAELARLRWATGIDAPPEKELLETWSATVDAFDEFGHVFEAARSRARLAGLLRAAGHTPEATAQAAQARDVARRLGAEPLLRELRTFGRGGRGAGEPSGAGPSETLTAREVEVLRLVAEGRSNREIAQQLFISAKTVSVHVSNILAKLGAAGRTEAAATARRRGLLD